MARRREPVSAIERYSIATKAWQTTRDISKFIGCGDTKSCELMNEMHEILYNRGKTPVKGHISKLIFHEYFEIDMQDLSQEAKDWAVIQNLTSQQHMSGEA